MEILDIEPGNRNGVGDGAEATSDSAHHHISQKEPRDSWKVPDIRSWAGFQLVPWRREVSYPITSLLSQPVPPGLRSYKHQPVLRGDLPRAPPLIPDGEEICVEEQMLTFSFHWAKHNNSTITKSSTTQKCLQRTKLFSSQDSESKKLFLGGRGPAAQGCLLVFFGGPPPGRLRDKGQAGAGASGGSLPSRTGDVPTNNQVAVIRRKPCSQRKVSAFA